MPFRPVWGRECRFDGEHCVEVRTGPHVPRCGGQDIAGKSRPGEADGGFRSVATCSIQVPVDRLPEGPLMLAVFVMMRRRVRDTVGQGVSPDP